MEAGEITSEKEECIKWNIENFRRLWECSRCLYSPDLTYSGPEYYLTLVKESNTEILVEIFPNDDTMPRGLYIEFQLHTEGNIVSKVHGITLHHRSYGVSVPIDFTEFVSRDSGTPLHDRLTVLLRMKELNGSCVLPDEWKGLKTLQKDLEKFFLNREDCDVTLEVKGIEFPAHRSILQARSPVFTVMFKHKMKETNSGIVTIEDSDPETFPDFLKYLYTGSTKHVSQENVCQLYTTSDKYEVMELKAKCAEFMKCHMTIETFCEYFFLAHMHTEEELIRSGIEFFCAHTVEIVKTAKWQIFLQQNSTIGNELFLEAQSRLLRKLSRRTNI